jgi:hypothetical protein
MQVTDGAAGGEVDSGADATPLLDAAPPADGGDASTIAPDAAPDAGCACAGHQVCQAGACVEPAACEGDADCLGVRQCVEGTCQDPCAGDEDCPDGTRCDPAQQRCTADAPCMADAECGDGMICVDRACAPSCMDGGCPGRQVCDPGSGRCLEPVGCGGDDDCSGGRRCHDGECVDECAEDAECPGAQTCADGRCVEPAVCSRDLDCSGDRRCDGGACIDPCMLAGCPGSLVCDDATGRCGEASPCADDAGCFAGRACVGGACVEPCHEDAACPGAQRCVDGRCTEPAVCHGPLDCDAGRVCDRGACRDRCDRTACEGALVCDADSGTCGEATPCAGDDGCFAGRRCEAGACHEGCHDNADCPGAMTCVDGRCAEAVPCSGDLDCLAGRVCRAGACRAGCAADADCPGTRRCAEGICVEGDGCAADADCDGGRHCDADLGSCVDPCDDAHPCAVGLACHDGRCVEGGVCSADDQCLGGHLCRLGSCREVQCEANADCADGRCVDWTCAPAPACDCPAGWGCVDGHCEQPGPCDARSCPAPFRCGDDGRCGACAVDADCGAGRCLDGVCANPLACAGPLDCLGDDACVGGRCEADPAACAEDALPPAHDPASAVPLPPLGVDGLFACEGAPDWFRVGDPSGIRVTARFAADGPPLALALYPADDPAADPVDVSAPTPGEAWVNAVGGDYLLRVSAPPGGARAYSLLVETGVACAADGFERPWRNDARERATPVGLGRHAGTLCPGDEDWFVYPVAAQVRVSVEGADVHADVGGMAAPAQMQGPVVIHVTGHGAYTLVLGGDESPAGRCAAAERLPLGSAVDASVDEGPDSFAPACRGAGGPERVFRVDVAAAGTLTAALGNPDPRASLLLYRDCAAAPVACGDALGQVSAPVSPGTWYLVVDGPYDGPLQADVGGAAGLCEHVDLLDPGVDTPIVAASPGGMLGGACLDPAGDAAARRISVPVASVARITVAGAADARVSVRGQCDEGATELDCVRGPAAFERPLAAGDYYVVFQGSGAMTAHLTLTPAGGGDQHFDDVCLPGGAPPVLESGAHLHAIGDTTASFDGFDATACGAIAGGHDQVLQFALAARSHVVATAQSDAFAPILMLSDGNCLARPTCPGGAASRFEADLDAGAHSVVVDGAGAGQRGAFTFDLDVQ